MYSDQTDRIRSATTTPWAMGVIVFQRPKMLKSMCSSPLATRCSLHLEVNSQCVINLDGSPLELSRPELPLLDGVQSRAVEAHGQTLEHPRVRYVATLVDDRLDDHDAGDARLACHLGV